MKIPGPHEISTVLAGVMSEPPSDSRTEALGILQGAMNEHTAAASSGRRMPDRRGGHTSGEPYDQLPVVSGRAAVGASSARTCDNCGARMSPRWPRQRVGAEMWCPSCVQNTGTRYAGLEDAENIIDWEKRYPERLVPVSDRKVSQPKKHPRKPFLDNLGRWPYRQELTEHEHIEPFEPVPFEQRQNGMPMHTTSARYAVRTGIDHLPIDAPPEQGLAYFLAADKPHILRTAHDSGSTEVVYHCFAGETCYLTREGTKSFAETADTVQWVMTAPGVDSHRGQWTEAVIHSFGPQPVVTVRLRRNKVTKTIRATPNHEWNVLGRQDAHRVVTTQDLKPGMRMAHLRIRRYFPEPDHEGIRMGFVFGDGAIIQRPHQTYGVAVLWGTKQDLAKYFDEVCTTTPRERTTANNVRGLAYTSGMVGYTKTLPPLTAPLEYLHGWLMGYFAADGSVNKTDISMTSSVLENLQHVRDVATLLGIGTYSVTSKWRTGFGVSSQIHTLGFSGKDMGTSFFLRRDHQDAYDLRDERGTNDCERFGWTIDAVEDAGEITGVYCARVPGTGSFVLEDNIWTRNCPFCGSGQVIARSDGTIECEFCQAAFTVQVQPEFSAFPQTVDGQSVDIPGMGGTSDNPDVPEDAGDDQEAAAGPTTPPGGTEEQPPEEGDPDGDTDEPVDSGGNPLFNKHSFRTASGAALDRDAYVRHLALGVATDRDRVLARIRGEKSR